MGKSFDEDLLYGTWVDYEEDLYRFEGDENLKWVDGCGSITRIIHRAFYGCSNLEWIELPETLIEIESDAFCLCWELDGVSLRKVKTIGDEAFKYCMNLETIDLGDSLVTLGNSVFEGCEKLNKISLPKTIARIGGCVFKDCGSKNGHFSLLYKGTKNDFRKVILDQNWNSGSTIEKISCVDGDLYIRKPQKEYL